MKLDNIFFLEKRANQNLFQNFKTDFTSGAKGSLPWSAAFWGIGQAMDPEQKPFSERVKTLPGELAAGALSFGLTDTIVNPIFRKFDAWKPTPGSTGGHFLKGLRTPLHIGSYFAISPLLSKVMGDFPKKPVDALFGVKEKPEEQ